jgi:hypothetical protein
MADYIEISTTGNISGAKKFRVLLEADIVDDGYTQAVDYQPATLDGSPMIAFGPGKKYFRYTLIFPYTGAAAGYANYADVQALFTTDTTAGNQFKFRAMKDTTVYDVINAAKGAWQPRLLTKAKYDSAAVYLADILLHQI